MNLESISRLQHLGYSKSVLVLAWGETQTGTGQGTGAGTPKQAQIKDISRCQVSNCSITLEFILAFLKDFWEHISTGCVYSKSEGSSSIRWPNVLVVQLRTGKTVTCRRGQETGFPPGEVSQVSPVHGIKDYEGNPCSELFHLLPTFSMRSKL